MISSFERRHCERHSFNDVIEVEHVIDPYDNENIFKGLAVNISDDGLCLIISTPLSEGQEITIKNSIVIPSQTATVYWIEKIDDSSYKVGLVFS